MTRVLAALLVALHLAACGAAQPTPETVHVAVVRVTAAVAAVLQAVEAVRAIIGELQSKCQEPTP